MAAAGAFGANRLPGFNLDQVRRYVKNEGLRGAILRHILDQLPTSGNIMLLAHSLGSVIAIDLLDHLPEKLRVRRFITLGSPANNDAVHSGSARLLKKFPYSRADDWTNFFSVRDVVPMGRGLASIFSGAQDFAIDIPGVNVHPAERHLTNPAVAKLVAQMLYPAKHVVRASSDIAVRLTDDQFLTLLKLRFAWAVAKNIEDKDAAQRYTDTLKVIQDNFAAALRQLADTGCPLAPELHSVIAGHLPSLPNRLELREAVVVLTTLTATNFVEPYEIDTGEAPKKALGTMLVNLGFSPSRNAHIVTALSEVDDVLKRTGGIPWGRIGVAAAGLALLAAGPVGLAVAAPAGAAGGAAIVGGLAAFGPGGMVGGLGMLGGLAAGGAGLAAGAALGESGPEALVLNVTQLSLRVAADYALKRLQLPVDTDLWGQLVSLETQVAAELNRLEPFSDPKATRIQQLRAAKDAVKKLLGFVVDKGIGGATGINDPPGN
jgi:pimeloyl-ACP methyl ester carboxylesterase